MNLFIFPQFSLSLSKTKILLPGLSRRWVGCSVPFCFCFFCDVMYCAMPCRTISRLFFPTFRGSWSKLLYAFPTVWEMPGSPEDFCFILPSSGQMAEGRARLAKTSGKDLSTSLLLKTTLSQYYIKHVQSSILLNSNELKIQLKHLTQF